MPESSPSQAHRLEVVLRKPWIGWHPRPTVVFGGRSQPAQWGSGTWQLQTDEPASVEVFLYNRMWAYGRAAYVINPSEVASIRLVYSAPFFPFLGGRLSADNLEPRRAR